MYQHIFFDLDGTLTDSFAGIAHSVAHALQEVCGIETPDLSTLRDYIGPPLLNGFMDNHQLDESTAARCRSAYRAHFEKGGLYDNEVYEGVRDMLATLHAQGYTLYVATSKPERFAKRILAYFDLMPYFARITGASMDGKIGHKYEVVAEALRLAQPADLSQCLMIGDRFHDIEGGKVNGIATMGVTYGFGTIEELQSAGADSIVHHPSEICNYLRR